MQVSKCPHCGGDLQTTQKFCSHCHQLLAMPDSNMSAYDLLEVNAKLSYTRQELNPHYFKWSLKLHPDRFISSPENVRQKAEEWSLKINEAYHLLLDPLKSAAYFLKFKGVLNETREEDTAPHLNQAPPLDLAEDYFELMDIANELKGIALKNHPAFIGLATAVQQKKANILHSWNLFSLAENSDLPRLQELLKEYGDLKYLISLEANLEKLWQK